jgi:hypothetical protein
MFLALRSVEHSLRVGTVPLRWPPEFSTLVPTGAAGNERDAERLFASRQLALTAAKSSRSKCGMTTAVMPEQVKWESGTKRVGVAGTARSLFRSIDVPKLRATPEHAATMPVILRSMPAGLSSRRHDA